MSDQDDVATLLVGFFAGSLSRLAGVLKPYEILISSDKKALYLWFPESKGYYVMRVHPVGYKEREGVILDAENDVY